MSAPSIAETGRRLRLQLPAALFAAALTGLALGGALHLAGLFGPGDLAWDAIGAFGAAYSLWTMLDSLRRTRVGVDVIALLALGGALTEREWLAPGGPLRRPLAVRSVCAIRHRS
ncbi:MAG: hypothetical protein M0Z40_17790 [Actinomycetota bacterium]|nr:hypothetical protein [Actinomycetota bacterium]